ncbi:hypothetical protein ABKN59_008716 [Abortiporus biennis]
MFLWLLTTYSQFIDDPQALHRLDLEWNRLSTPHSDAYIEDRRTAFVDYNENAFYKMLHPVLQSLAPLLGSLTRQICPEYAYLSPPPPEDHLHEALSRLLLQFIVDMEEDIPLDPDNLRPVDCTGIRPSETSESLSASETVDTETDLSSDLSDSGIGSE